MAPKGKAKQPEWNLCTFCNCIVSKRDLLKHSAGCTSVEHFDAVKPTHGFLKNGILHAVVSKMESKDVSKLCFEGAIYLNQGAMHLSGICIGKPVLCTFGGVQEVLTAWPNSQVPPCNAAFSDTEYSFPGVKLKPGDYILIEKFVPTYLNIFEVTLAPENFKDFMDTTEFKKYFAATKNQSHIRPGSCVCISYLGQMCRFITRKFVTIDGKTYESCSTFQNLPDIASESYSPSSMLCESTSRLNITDSSSSESHLAQSEAKADHCHINLITGKGVVTSTPKKGEYAVISSQYSTPVKCDKQWRHHSDFYVVTMNTKIKILCEVNETENNLTIQKKVGFSSIGGLSEQIKIVREIVELSLKGPTKYKVFGASHVKGILLFGPPGCGKTMMVKALLNELKIHSLTISGPEVYSKFYGETEAKLRGIFVEAVANAPSAIFFDDIEALCPRRESGVARSQQENRVVSTLLTMIDNIKEDPVFVIAATCKPELLDSALRRPGRLGKEVEIPVPTASDRTNILHILLHNVNHSLTAEDIVSVADAAHGYVGADLAAVCREAGLCALKRIKKSLGNLTDVEIASRVSVSLSDMSHAIKAVKPSAMREVMLEVPKVLWTDIGGQHKLKQKFQQAIEWPLKYPDAFKRMGIQPPRGILMYGPPGCSKTMIAKAIATESGLNFIAVKGPELFSKWVGESEQAVREVFRKARLAAPSVVFFDEIDALAVERGGSGGSHNVGERVLAQLLTEMDGVEVLENVVVVAATNRPDMIDKALLRPGRLDRVIYVPLPDVETRTEIIQLQLQKMPLAADVNKEELAKLTEGHSGAELVAVCKEAALAALEEDMNAEQVFHCHFLKSLSVVKPRTDKKVVEFYENYANNLETK